MMAEDRTPDGALAHLLEGNARYVAGRMEHPHKDPARRAAVAGGQWPCAVVLGCSDSRVPPEILFDQGVGDLFVVRTAGHVVDAIELASIEYAVGHLHVPLVVVMGHSRCGAVAAAAAGEILEGQLPLLADAILPAVDAVRGTVGDLADLAAREHARRVAQMLRVAEPVVAPLVKWGEVQIAAAFYDLESGAVTVLS